MCVCMYSKLLTKYRKELHEGWDYKGKFLFFALYPSVLNFKNTTCIHVLLINFLGTHLNFSI